MKVKIFTPNRDGKIEFNQKDLESLLNEIYEELNKEFIQREHT